MQRSHRAGSSYFLLVCLSCSTSHLTAQGLYGIRKALRPFLQHAFTLPLWQSGFYGASLFLHSVIQQSAVPSPCFSLLSASKASLACHWN
ncbi:hypothetical protein DFS33DRAFT_118018 [Desarmillaria ectypa]|nr:hypothetical protein DFS33DRAFT_118018 [Desarmillaria ectypa]